MTTPTNEEVRRQFEAAVDSAVEAFDNLYDGVSHNKREAICEVVASVLRSPAVAGLVDVAEDMLCPSYRGPDQDRLRAALAQYATLAGESHE